MKTLKAKVMTNEQKKNIVELVNQRMTAKGLSENQAAAQIDMSNASLNNIRNGKWDNVSERLWLKAAQWAGYQNTTWKLKETANLKNIMSLCYDAQENARMMAAAGASGFGKTTALKHYAATTANAFYMLCDVTMSKKDFLNAILKSMGLDIEGSIHARVQAIIEHLLGLPHPLLIIDDAGKLNDGCMKLIQVFYDRTEGHCGIILAGTDAFKNYIIKMAAKDKLGFKELKRRIAYWQPLKGVSDGFIKATARDFGITSEPALEYIKGHCNDFGSIRELLTNYAKLVDRLKAAGKTIEESERELLASIHFGNQTTKEAA